MYENLVTILLILLLIYHIYFYSNLFQRKPIKVDENLYFNLNMKDICSAMDKSDKNDKSCEKPKTKSCSDQLFDMTKQYNELKLQLDDTENTPETYSFYNSDRYLIDPGNKTGDDVLMQAMIDTQKKNKQSIDNRSMWEKSSFLPYIEEELRQHENSVWWESDNDLEAIF
jgi:hypothetical protein